MSTQMRTGLGNDASSARAISILLSMMAEFFNRSHSSALLYAEHASTLYQTKCSETGETPQPSSEMLLEDLLRAARREISHSGGIISSFETIYRYVLSHHDIPTADECDMNAGTIEGLFRHFPAFMTLVTTNQQEKITFVLTECMFTGKSANEVVTYIDTTAEDDDWSAEFESASCDFDGTYLGRGTCPCDLCRSIDVANKDWKTWEPTPDSIFGKMKYFIDMLETALLSNEIQ